MADFCRVAQAAIRSSSLRSSASRWSLHSFSIAPKYSTPSIRQISTTPLLRSIQPSNGTNDPSSSSKSPTSRSQHQNYSSTGWASPFRETAPAQENPEDITKPDIFAYEDDLIQEIDFTSGELNKSKIMEDRPAPTRPTIRLVPRTGRTVNVGRNVDVARALKLLNTQLIQNKVRSDFNLQKFHERPGLKRKRLRSQRWQGRFKIGFKACVKRVKELAKQGW
ncbi:hypothetical protein GGS26DRAFT_306939 [Hypomontagnella submonticulosa]|nr:hypothetical protein GGS26DRAFT_306939 [Hypomontagnella submonticulosa]